MPKYFERFFSHLGNFFIGMVFVVLIFVSGMVVNLVLINPKPQPYSFEIRTNSEIVSTAGTVQSVGDNFFILGFEPQLLLSQRFQEKKLPQSLKVYWDENTDFLENFLSTQISIPNQNNGSVLVSSPQKLSHNDLKAGIRVIVNFGENISEQTEAKAKSIFFVNTGSKP